jgi:hypothetical protein
MIPYLREATCIRGTKRKIYIIIDLTNRGYRKIPVP